MANLFALVPVKHPAQGKSRLAPVLRENERRALNTFLAQHTLGICAECFGRERTLVVTASATIARLAGERGIRVVSEGEHSSGLNLALVIAADCAVSAGAAAILVVPTDLALLSVPALRAAAAAIPESPGCLLVPDRHNSGTNLLGLTPVRSDLFLFGELSLQRHAKRAAQLGYAVRVVRSEELALDVDTPEDYAAWKAGPAGRTPAQGDGSATAWAA